MIGLKFAIREFWKQRAKQSTSILSTEHAVRHDRKYDDECFKSHYPRASKSVGNRKNRFS